ncbi:polysaccharide deacetylase family protein [Terriglobus roseus]|uniref:Polysaccharide deacetylase n=1 Tax=Terriglobus roseus TaxID=392734 RepID=A0A1H4SJY4_9BACT|nr:polysaccharide deacetylase family protein [Terriglobus roseus]SEC44515.1 Polysaccharide deacetylase [Terriglobus roseus]
MMQSVDTDYLELSNMRAFAYHEICNASGRDTNVSPENFFQQLATLCGPSRRPRGPVAITFDDGHASNIAMAAPILEGFSLKAHFFITTDWISTRPECMTWNDIRSLAKSAHTIGSHSASHPVLPRCPHAKLAQELVSSRKRLEDHIGRQVKTISMPDGRWNESVIRACAAAGYEVVYTSEPGFYRPPALSGDLMTPTIIGRCVVRSGTNLRTIATYAEGRSTAVHLLQAAYYLRHGVRSVIATDAYQRLRSHLSRTAAQ